MNIEQITAVARKHGQSYTSRPFINGLSFAFGNEAWAAFCEALASPQPVQQSVQPVAVISGAFGGRPCIRVLDTAAIYPDGTALYTSPPIAQPVPQAPLEEFSKIVEILADAHKDSTQGKWRRGQTSHHTVTEMGYAIGEFHHACDAAFCDVAHRLIPVLLEKVGAKLAQPVQPKETK